MTSQDQYNCTWIGALRGRFIVFDGPDGSGKSTQFRAIADMARANGVEVREVREPGGTAVGERIREILLDPIHDEMALRCEMMLYMASRAQLVEQIIRPALRGGALVLADRFVSSTYAYQGAAGGLPMHEIDAVASAACGDRAGGGTWPDLTVIFDVDGRTAATRLNPTLDRMEQKGAEFHARVRQGYLDQAARDPGHYAVIDAHQNAEAVTGDTLSMLRQRLAGRGVHE